jgi:hypothetical protein
MSGLRTKTGAELAITRRLATFNADLKWRELWKSVELAGTGTVGERKALLVKFIPKDGEGQPQTNYYDAETFALLRSDTVQESAMGTVPSTSYFTDYRSVGGILMPFAMEIQNSMMTMKMTITEATFDVAIDDSKFAKPQ